MKVSVLTPSYNHASFLRTAIESVIAQTHSDWELIIVDDRSSDDSVIVARSFRDDRIKLLINDRNLGAYGALNVALANATGDLIAVLNSDDYWHPDKLSAQAKLLSKYPGSAMSYTLGCVVAAQGEPLPVQDHHAEYPVAEEQDLLPHLFEVNRVLASSVVFRRGALDQFDETLRYSGDWVAALRLARNGRVAFVPEAMTFWRHHPENASRQLDRTIPEEIRVRRGILSDLSRWQTPHSEPTEIRRSLGKCATLLAGLYVLVGDMASAAQTLRLALSLDPSNSTAKKRYIASFLPKAISQKRIWPNTDPRPFEAMYRASDLQPIQFD